MTQVELCRRFYAEEVRVVAGLKSEPLVEAFAAVAREQFLGPGPWQLFTLGTGLSVPGYQLTPDARPERVYHNVSVAIDPSRQLNNGQPSTIATFIEALDLQRGDRALHIGAGTGYYTAIIAELVGADGHLDGVEIDPHLATMAERNLTAYRQVRVSSGDGSKIAGPYDAIFVNAGATHPRSEWLEALADGGRLILPWTAVLPPFPHGAGYVAKIVRAKDALTVRFISTIAIYHCAGARDPSLEAKLGPILRQGAWKRIQFLRRDVHQEAESCVLHSESFCFSEKAAGN